MDNQEVAVRLTVAMVGKSQPIVTRELPNEARTVVACYQAILEALPKKQEPEPPTGVSEGPEPPSPIMSEDWGTDV